MNSWDYTETAEQFCDVANWGLGNLTGVVLAMDGGPLGTRGPGGGCGGSHLVFQLFESAQKAGVVAVLVATTATSEWQLALRPFPAGKGPDDITIPIQVC